MISVPALFLLSSLHIYDNINRNYYVLKKKEVLLYIGQLSVAVYKVQQLRFN